MNRLGPLLFLCVAMFCFGLYAVHQVAEAPETLFQAEYAERMR